jgi:hypothetical protein
LWIPVPKRLRQAEIISEKLALSSRKCDTRDRNNSWDTHRPFIHGEGEELSHALTIGFFIGTAVAGVGFGGGFQGGIRLVLPLVDDRERAGVLSSLYIVSYLGLGVPAVIAGVLVTEVNGLLATAQEYGSAVIVLAVVALGGLLAHRPQKAAALALAASCGAQGQR